MDRQSILLYAIKGDSPVSISDVESGLKCNCVCPVCGEQLVARKGQKRKHHFAHYSGKNCEYAYESSLHLAAKEILLKVKRITIPPVYVYFPSNKEPELLYGEKEIVIEKVELEKRFDWIIPDVVVYSGGKKFFIEIIVTHPIDNAKLLKIRESGIATLEIDLSKKKHSISIQELTPTITNYCVEKKWVYNKYAEEYLNRFITVAEIMNINRYGRIRHVENCPIGARGWAENPYADYDDDCLSCEFCISKGEPLLCSGRAKIAHISDFSKTK